jgi:hypothetical protein
MIATNVSNHKNNEYQLKLNSIQMATPKTVLEAPKRISIIDRGKSWVCVYIKSNSYLIQLLLFFC